MGKDKYKPVGKLELVKADIDQRGSQAVYVNIYLRDEEGDLWLLEDGKFLYDLNQVTESTNID